jgi:hypothetical protein
VLALTDGENSTSLPGREGTPESVEQKAIRDDFMLYAIGMEGAPIEGRLVPGWSIKAAAPAST